MSLSDDVADTVSETLEALAGAGRSHRGVRTLRGVRGLADGEIARVAAATWSEHGVQDDATLDRLFGAALEDGLVAIGLLGAGLPDDPAAALAVGLGWAERVDDVLTADALGWLVLGPGALLSAPDPVAALAPVLAHRRPEARRAGVAAGLAWLPASIEGPAAAPLRARLGTRHVRWADAPQEALLARLAAAAGRDTAPAVQKITRKLLRAWTHSAPDQVAAWGAGRTGLSRLLADEVRRAVRSAS